MAFFFVHLLKAHQKILCFFLRWRRGCIGCCRFCRYTIGLWIESLSKRAWRIYAFSNSLLWKHICLVCCCLHLISDETIVSSNVFVIEEIFVCWCCELSGRKLNSNSVLVNLDVFGKLFGQCFHLPMGGAHLQKNCNCGHWVFWATCCAYVHEPCEIFSDRHCRHISLFQLK